MERHNHKVGDRVQVMNATLGGKMIVEGIATIKRLLPGEDRYIVQFDGDRERFERYVAPGVAA